LEHGFDLIIAMVPCGDPGPLFLVGQLEERLASGISGGILEGAVLARELDVSYITLCAECVGAL
jgi:hypothetical protein